MKLREVVEDCLEIKDYLQELTGSNDKIDMGIRFQNLELVYIMPEIFEAPIDKAAKKCFKKQNGRYVVRGAGKDCIKNVQEKLQQFEKVLR